MSHIHAHSKLCLVGAALAVSALGLARPSLAVPQSIEAPQCSSSPSLEPRLFLIWPAIPSESSLAVLAPANVALSVRNRDDGAVTCRLVGHMVAGGVRRSQTVTTATIGGGGAATFQVALDSFGIALDQLDFSGSLYIEASTLNSSGVLLDRAFSPAIYFHEVVQPTGSVDLLVYGSVTRRGAFNAGDLNYAIYPSGAPASVQGIFDGGAGVGSASEDHGPVVTQTGNHPGLMRAISPQPLGLGMWEFCMRWVYQSVDSGIGEDYYTSGNLMKARGMKVEVMHPNWPASQIFHASQDNGCFSFFATESSGFQVTVHGEAVLGQQDNLVVRAFETKDLALHHPEDYVRWEFVANPGGSPRRVYYQNEASEESNLMAFGSFVLHWVDVHTNPGLTDFAAMFLASDNPTCTGGGSCQPGIFVEMEPGKSTRKFLVGHEVGHWIHRQWTDNDMGYYNSTWSANSGDADCAFVGVGDHAMRSKEYSVGAFTEGFAHYLSALAWNDHAQTDGWFKYYKEVAAAAYADFAADDWRLDIEGVGASPSGGLTSWMANMCSVNDGHSVEMDWLRFFWDYRTNAGYGAKPTHHDIFEHVQFTRSNHAWNDNFSAYDKLLEALQDPALGQLPLQIRWNALAPFNGVAQ